MKFVLILTTIMGLIITPPYVMGDQKKERLQQRVDALFLMLDHNTAIIGVPKDGKPLRLPGGKFAKPGNMHQVETQSGSGCVSTETAQVCWMKKKKT